MPWFRLHLTNLCNFNCPGCHVFKISENKVPATNMPYEVAEKAVLFLIGTLKKYLPQARGFTMSIYGGEPLLNRPVLYKLLEKFGANYEGVNISWIVNTNGSLLNKEDLKRFLPCGADIHMSVDGKEEKHNKTRRDKLGRPTFNRVMAAIGLIKKNNYPFLQFDSVANPFELETMNEVLEVAADKGVSRIHCDPYYSPDYPNDFSVEKYSDKYSEAYIRGKELGINIFSTPFTQVYESVLYGGSNMSGMNSAARFPIIEVFADGSFIFSELPLIRSFDSVINLSEESVWSRRMGELMALEKEKEIECGNCDLMPHCGGELRRVYRYHTITKRNEENICEIAWKAIKKLKQQDFIPMSYVKR